MSISIACSCGKKYRVKETLAGKKIRCADWWFESTNGGVLGGVLMIVIAVVWFGAGLAGGRIFFYPPVLLIIGLVAVCKGLFNRE
jgi:hypothetical protein